MFTHILMTRFNLATPGREMAIRTQSGWLDERFRLFERYCLPAVVAQRSHNFDWIIYFDIDTPQPFKDRIEDLRRVFPFKAYYTPQFQADGWSKSIFETFDIDTPLLLTTRLDNDDALAVDFTERLYAAVNARTSAIGAYNFRNGLIRRDNAIYALKHSCNAFFSWLDPLGKDMRTALAIAHMKLYETGSVHQIEGPPAWLQIVHDTNVSNKVRGRRVQPSTARDRFPEEALLGLAEASMGALALDGYLRAPLRDLRDALLSLRR